MMNGLVSFGLLVHKFCPLRPLVLISALTDCQCPKIGWGTPQILFQLNLVSWKGISLFHRVHRSLFSKPCVVLWEIIPEKSISKSTPVLSEYGSGMWDIIYMSFMKLVCISFVLFTFLCCDQFSILWHWSVFAQLFLRRIVLFDNYWRVSSKR